MRRNLNLFYKNTNNVILVMIKFGILQSVKRLLKGLYNYHNAETIFRRVNNTV